MKYFNNNTNVSDNTYVSINTNVSNNTNVNDNNNDDDDDTYDGKIRDKISDIRVILSRLGDRFFVKMVKCRKINISTI